MPAKLPATMTPKRTILLDGDSGSPQQARLGAALAGRGWRVFVLDAPAVVAQIGREFNQECEHLRGMPTWTGPLRTRHLQRLARENAIDVVHLNFLWPKHRAWSDDLTGPAYVATAWGSDLNEEVFKRPLRHVRTVSEVLRRASAVTADSAPLLAKAVARMGDNPAPRQIVYWSVDLPRFDPAAHAAATLRFREQLGIAPGTRVLLSPRQAKPHYHIDRIIAGFAASGWAADGVLVLKLHGKKEEAAYVARLLDQARVLGVHDRVRLAPRLSYEDLPGLYALADAAVSLPEADGVPSTFLELMALAVPIVASDLPAYAGVLTADDNALLVPSGDAGGLVQALDRLHRDAELGARLTRNGSAWVRTHGDWQQAVEQWIALYEHAIVTPRPV